MCVGCTEIIVSHLFGPQIEPLKIKIMKMRKGYNWEISCAGSAMAEILSKVRAADATLHKEYGGV